MEAAWHDLALITAIAVAGIAAATYSRSTNATLWEPLADIARVNTIAASTRRVPRAALIGIVVLIAAFAALMIVRAGVIGGSSSDSTAIPAPSSSPTPAKPVHTSPAKPTVVLLPGLPAQIASKLRYSKVVVVSLYTGTAAGDRAAVAEARHGAREVGAGFTAVNVLDEKQARAVAAFGGPVDSPAVLVVRRPGKIVTQFTGSVDDKIVAQAAHNAGAGS